MKFFTFLTLGASVAIAAPYEPTSPTYNVERTASTQSCDKASISACVSTTGLDGTACFAQVCTSLQAAAAVDDEDEDEDEAEDEDDDEIDFKTESSSNTPASCTEDNLLDCTGDQGKNPDVCFQQLCL